MTSGKPLRVAIQGERGAFSHQAAIGALGPEIEVLPRATFDELFDSVVDGLAERALVPIENSLHGSIHENYDRLKNRPLHIVGETQLRIRQCLIGRPGSSLGMIRRVASHPVALAQCRRFFAERPQVEAVSAYDTAGAVQDLMKGGLATQAAIASRLAAELYGGVVLLEGIEDDAENYTRFLLLAREAVKSEEPASKTSIVFVLDNRPGALYQALGVFAARKVDLCKLESRPLRGHPWEYSFYLDVLGDPCATAGEAIEELGRSCRELRILGSYPEGLSRNGV
ncbi:MAG TPA: prephenate dehydratase [Vicinamibacteria bacterium]|nr:prephenate dehydratase [Vicinamibacteria bacterium]